MRVREKIAKLGYDGGKTIVDDLLRELRPRYLRPRTFQRTSYRRGEFCQFDLCEPRREIPVGWGQTRRGLIVTAELPYSRAFAGALVFSKELAAIAWGMNRCLVSLGALPAKLVCDREGAIHAGGGRPTESFAAYSNAPPAANCCTGKIFITDKGSPGAEFEQFIADALGAQLIRPDRRDEQPRYGPLGGIRQWIESINDTLKGQFSLERHGGHTPGGVWVRVCQRVLALAAGCWHSWQINQSGRTFIAYDH